MARGREVIKNPVDITKITEINSSTALRFFFDPQQARRLYARYGTGHIPCTMLSASTKIQEKKYRDIMKGVPYTKIM